jgi:hypothetical protein
MTTLLTDGAPSATIAKTGGRRARGADESMRLMDAGVMVSWEASPVGDPACLRVVLDLERGRDPVCGWVAGPNGVRERFEGLLGLLAALDAARAADWASVDAADEDRGGS